MGVIDRSKLSSVAVVFVVMLALSMTAATIHSTSGPEERSGLNFDPDHGAEPDSDFDRPNQSGGTGELGTSGAPIDLTICIEILRTPGAVIGILAVLSLFFYGLYRRYNAATTLLVGSGVVPVVFASYFFLTNCATQFGGELGPDGSFNPAAGGSLVQVPAVPSWAVGLVLVGVIGLVAVLLVSVTGTDEEFLPVEVDEFEDPDATDFAAAAGRAADRIERGNVAVDNAVYRAWLEMTSLLELPNPRSSAPLDFADAAIELGLDEDDVLELTELFNEVRYGHKDAESREERAIEILRHIESTYGVTTSDEYDEADTGGEE